ncbi:MAG TPA: pyruvate kinase [Candidatus Dormibacteraeota bacterium]|nr:pyruvate kinase [Candidatus Dormibacteraeota bacterium]
MKAARRTRIVCTLGPSSVRPAVVRRLVAAGMDVARLNFSHGDADTHRAAARVVREAAAAGGRHVALLQDLQGPKVRTGSFEPPLVRLQRGGQVTVTSRAVTGGPQMVPLSHRELVDALRPRDRVLLADGQIELRVREVAGPDVRCTVVRGGLLEARRGVIAPGRPVALPALTDKDLADLDLGRELDFDYVALSFVRGVEDVRACRAALKARGLRTPVVAKLERGEAIRHLGDILGCVDGVMVARGDLGVELSLAEVPAIQKDVIERSNRAGVPVITATEMLESMVTSNRPTRAEASDVANAIWDGTDAVMLSQETSVGAHPVEAVRAMAGICLAAESHAAYLRGRRAWYEPGSTGAAIARAAASVAEEVGARAIVAFTESGMTARRVSKARPAVPVIAASPHPGVLRRTALYAGVVPLEVEQGHDTDDMIGKGTRAALERGLVRPGDRIACVAGVPVGAPGQTNLVKVEVVR